MFFFSFFSILFRNKIIKIKSCRFLCLPRFFAVVIGGDGTGGLRSAICSTFGDFGLG